MKSAFNPEEQAQNIDAKLIYGLEKVSQIYRILLWQTQAETGLSPIQSQILIFMSFHDEKIVSISNFAIEFSVTKATVSDAFKTLTKKGLVYKQKDTTDKRRQILKLTNDGTTLAMKINNYTKPFDDVLQDFPIKTKITLFSILTDILNSLNQKNLLSPLRMCASCHYFEIKNKKSYCNLLEAYLKDEEIRLDCPEYESRKEI